MRGKQKEYKIIPDVERAYLAAMVDGEGTLTMSIHKTIDSRTKKERDRIVNYFQITNTSLELMKKCQEYAGCGKIYKSYFGGNRKDGYKLCFFANETRNVLAQIKDYLILKKDLAEKVLEFYSRISEGKWRFNAVTDNNCIDIYNYIRTRNKRGVNTKPNDFLEKRSSNVK